jgi:Lipase (class 3)
MAVVWIETHFSCIVVVAVFSIRKRHSLGGALATVFAFGAAALDDTIAPKPVTLLTIGAPYVGDESFADSFQLMESLGMLRCCRVVNQKDIITCVPKMAFRWKFYDPQAHVGTLFKHVGMAIRLYEGQKPFEIIYRRKREGRYTSLWDEMVRGWDQTLFTQFDWKLNHYSSWPWHKLRSYNERLQIHEHVLKTTYLNDLYSRPEHVGRLVPQF